MRLVRDARTDDDMAYQRWGRGSDWYAFWESTRVPVTQKADERLALWHVHAKGHSYRATYAEARSMLASGDFSAIPGFREEYRSIVRDTLDRFTADVDTEYDSRSPKLGSAAPGSDSSHRPHQAPASPSSRATLSRKRRSAP